MKLFCVLAGLALLSAAAVPSAAMAAETTSYTYDALGRLTKVVTMSGRTTEYKYDAANNRTEVISTGGSSGRVVVLPLLGGLVIPLP
jgi:YD repeat-containing protein